MAARPAKVNKLCCAHAVVNIIYILCIMSRDCVAVNINEVARSCTVVCFINGFMYVCIVVRYCEVYMYAVRTNVI